MYIQVNICSATMKWSGKVQRFAATASTAASRMVFTYIHVKYVYVYVQTYICMYMYICMYIYKTYTHMNA